MAFIAAAAAVAVAESDPDPAHHGVTADLSSVVQQNPMLACSILEAALHVAPAYHGPPSAVFNSNYKVNYASNTCFAAAVVMPILAEAAAARLAAAPQQATGSAAAATAASKAAGIQQAAAPAAAGISSNCSKLEQKLFCMLMAALKYVQCSAALSTPNNNIIITIYNNIYNYYI